MKNSNKDSNYENTVGKHPIPHAEGMARGESRDLERSNKSDNGNKNSKSGQEEE